jgi:hypothetical protein
MRQFELVKFSIWTAKKLEETNRTVNEWLTRGWSVLSVCPGGDSVSVYIAFYRADTSGWR